MLGLGKLKTLLTLNKAVGQYEQIKKEIDTSMNSKSLFMSKTFWGNIAGLALTLGGVLPEKYAAYVLIAGNVIMRLVTNQPVNLFPENTK